MEIFIVLLFVGFIGVLAATLIAKNLIYLCGPNEVLVFSGGHYMGQDGITRGYKVIKGGRGTRIPLFETVDRIDLTNMIIDRAQYYRHALAFALVPFMDHNQWLYTEDGQGLDDGASASSPVEVEN